MSAPPSVTLPIGGTFTVTTVAFNPVTLTSSNVSIAGPSTQQGPAPNPAFTLTVAGYGIVQLLATQGGTAATAAVDVYGALALVSAPATVAGIPGTTTFSIDQPGPASGAVTLSIACATGAAGSVLPLSLSTGAVQTATVTITAAPTGPAMHTCIVTATGVGGTTLMIPIDAYATPVTIN